MQFSTALVAVPAAYCETNAIIFASRKRMKPDIESVHFPSSSLSAGRCFVYVMPCAYEDILKLGFSRDPVQRLQTLHRRYFEFFDLDQAFLIETETVRDARELELTLGKAVELHNAPAPLVVRSQAGGHTEWYRGAYGLLLQAATDLSGRGYVLHQPVRPWLRLELLAGSDRLFAWSSEMWAAIESGVLDNDTVVKLQTELRNALDAYVAFDIDIEQLLPHAVFQWHRHDSK